MSEAELGEAGEESLDSAVGLNAVADEFLRESKYLCPS